MKSPPRYLEYLSKDSMLKNSFTSPWTLPKSMIFFIVLISLPCVFYSLMLLKSSNAPNQELQPQTFHRSQHDNASQNLDTPEKTSLKHIVFGIGASASTWDRRKNYVKIWWRRNVLRGYVWLDKQPVQNSSDDNHLPPIKISSNTSNFEYKHPLGTRDAIRIARIVSESVRLGMKDVRWFVMGDDDTVFIPDNVAAVLAKYDHNQFYYIGYRSESHLQNLAFHFGMAFGGGGFAISYALAKALEKTQDDCMHKYPTLYGSDERIHACLTELGVPLTKEPGFHQFDLRGNLFGLLSAHPIAPLVSLHHLDVIEPVFPNMDRVKAVQRLSVPMKLDAAALIQQSICYDKTRRWTVSVSWGYAVQIYRGIVAAKELGVPSRTFIDWNYGNDDVCFSLNTRRISNDPCQKPFVYYVSNALYNVNLNLTASEYVRHRVPDQGCWWKIADPSRINRVEVYKKPDPLIWERAPRRNCCRVLPTKKKGSLVIDVGECREGEVIGLL